MFPQIYEKCYDALTSDKPVVVTGKLDMKGAEPKIVLDDMIIWDIDNDSQNVAPIVNNEDMIINVLCVNEDEKNFVQAICLANPGETLIRIHFGKDPQSRKVFRGNININDEILNQIKNRLGEKRVKFVANPIK